VAQASIQWNNLLAQERVKDLLGAAFASSSLGHAYLFCGEEGVGKFEAALDLALALLCAGGPPFPCGECDPCRKAERNAHPDLHVVVPVSLDKEHKNSDGALSAAGWEYLSAVVREKIGSPYAKAPHQGVPAIPVEWVKEVNHAILRGPVESKHAVSIIAGVDLMNKESANAMLKTLEEPPQNTFIILTTSMPQSVLATIASRCQIVRFGLLPVKVIRKALGKAHPEMEKAALDRAANYAMGSVSRGLSLASAEQDEAVAEARVFLASCCTGDWPAVRKKIDAGSRADGYDTHTRLFTNLMYLLRNGFLKNEGCSETYIDESDGSATASIPLDIGRAGRIAGACQDALNALAANGNPGIVYVNFALTIMELCNVEKQQAG
jgi:DNA polymerase III delta' subunit